MPWEVPHCLNIYNFYKVAHCSKGSTENTVHWPKFAPSDHGSKVRSMVQPLGKLLLAFANGTALINNYNTASMQLTKQMSKVSSLRQGWACLHSLFNWILRTGEQILPKGIQTHFPGTCPPCSYLNQPPNKGLWHPWIRVLLSQGRKAAGSRDSSPSSTVQVEKEASISNYPQH